MFGELIWIGAWLGAGYLASRDSERPCVSGGIGFSQGSPKAKSTEPYDRALNPAWNKSESTPDCVVKGGGERLIEYPEERRRSDA